MKTSRKSILDTDLDERKSCGWRPLQRTRKPRDGAAVAAARELHQALKDAGFDVKFAVASSDGYLPVTVVKGVGTFYNTDEEVYADTPNGEGEEIECDGPSVVAWAKRCNGPVRESSSKVLSILCEEDQGPRAACGTR